MKLLKLALLFVPLVVLADTGWRQGNASLGPVRDIDCTRDGGLWCSRDAGTQIGSIKCLGATATETGCVTPNAQTLAGDKTLTGDLRLVGHVHASLTACDANHKGTRQTCTTHNAEVFCNGTDNIETLGSASAEELLWPIYVNGIPGGFFGAITLSSTSGGTITSVMGSLAGGSGSGSATVSLTHSGGTCTCTIDCDAPASRNACTGNCSLSAGASVGCLGVVSGCTLAPYVNGNLNVMWTRP